MLERDQPRYSVIPARAASDTRLTLGDLRTLNALGVFADKHGVCFPSYAEIEDRFFIPKSTSRRCVKRLQTFGYIEVISRARDGSFAQTSNEYRIVHDACQAGSGRGDDAAEKRTPVLKAMSTPPVPTAMDTPMPTQVSTGNEAPVSTQVSTPHAHLDEPPPCSQGEHPITTHLTTHLTTHSLAPADLPPTGGAGLFGDAVSEAPPPKPRRKPKAKAPYTDEFEVYWKRWPQAIRANSDKPTSAARWKAARERYSADTLMLAAQTYLANTKVTDADPGPWKPRTCQAQVFLNGKLDAAVEAALAASVAHDPAGWRERDQICINGQWCWPDGKPVEHAPAAPIAR